MPYKAKENEKLRGIILENDLWDQFTGTARLLGIPVRHALADAVEKWTDSKMDDLAKSMESGSGVLGLFKKYPEKFKAALDELRNQNKQPHSKNEEIKK
jgi:hypothetical protein